MQTFVWLLGRKSIGILRVGNNTCVFFVGSQEIEPRAFKKNTMTVINQLDCVQLNGRSDFDEYKLNSSSQNRITEFSKAIDQFTVDLFLNYKYLLINIFKFK